MKRRVVVTGIGAITPLGCNFPAFWENALAGKSGVSEITRWDVSQYPVRIAGEIKDFTPGDFFDKKLSRRMDRFIQFAYASSLEALADSRLDLDKTDRDRTGIFIGSGIGGLTVIEEQRLVIEHKGPLKVTPFLVPSTTIDMASGQVSIQLGLRGPNYAVSSACATGNNAIGLAFRSIKYDETDVMFCGGTECAITPLGMAGFASARALSTRNDEPATASRPFDKNRDGFVMGEGGAILVLEELGHALRRDAHIYAEVLGFAATGDGYHLTAPHPEGEGAVRAMRACIKEAGLDVSEIAHVNAHATATELGDLAEIKALKTVFGEHAKKLTINATKSLVGHLLGGSGALGAACAINSVEKGIIPPSINIFTKDPECDLNIATEKQELDIPYALCNAFGFGGHNTALIFGRFTS